MVLRFYNKWGVFSSPKTSNIQGRMRVKSFPSNLAWNMAAIAIKSLRKRVISFFLVENKLLNSEIRQGTFFPE
jgi:hypothetical protein